MKTYTNRKKKTAVALAKKLGPTKAAHQLGIPSGTISCWFYKARKAAREGVEWPPPKGRPSRPSAPRLVAVEVEPELADPESAEPAWELESPRGVLLRVRTALSPGELERVLLAMAATEAAS